MDLIEQHNNVIRHPWETSRYKMVQRLLESEAAQDHAGRILDVGCGDGWLIKRIVAEHAVDIAHAVDPFLSLEQTVSGSTSRVSFYNDFRALRHDYNVVLMMDVLEHVKDDAAFLKDIVQNRAQEGGIFIITVPAHQGLFSAHDVFLKHFRRYDHATFLALLERSGLEIKSKGAMFASLLLPRFMECLRERFLEKKPQGLSSSWPHGKYVTRILELALDLDNEILFFLSRFHIPVTGLTMWAVARKPYAN